MTVMSAQKHKERNSWGCRSKYFWTLAATVPLARFSVEEKAMTEVANKVQKVRQMCYNRSVRK